MSAAASDSIPDVPHVNPDLLFTVVDAARWARSPEPAQRPACQPASSPTPRDRPLPHPTSVHGKMDE